MGVICHHTMSLDGYIAGPDDSMDWAFALGQPTSLADDRLYGGEGDGQIDLQRVSLGEGRQLTDLHLRVISR